MTYFYIFLFSMPIFGFLIAELASRLTFVYGGYPRRYGHGKTGHKAKKHYKANWTFWQRIFWIPVFKEYYESDFRILAYLSYVHAFLTGVTIGSYWILLIFVPNREEAAKLWCLTVMVVYVIFFCLRIIFAEHLGMTFHRKHGKSKYRRK